MEPLFKVFIQNETGSKIKNRHNEKTFEHLGSIWLEEAYPFPYGFVIGTTTDDGDNLDCYLITQENLSANTIVECQPVGLLELNENGETDHKVIAVLPGESTVVTDDVLDPIRRFYDGISKQFPTKAFKVGGFLPATAAIDFIKRSKD